MKIADLITISANFQFINRCEKLSQRFDFAFLSFKSPDEYFEAEVQTADVKCFVLDCTQIENIHEAAGSIQVAHQMMERSYIIAIISSRISPEEMALLKKSGANLILMEDEFVENSKLEFVTTQIIKASYIPIKQVDLIPDTKVPCDIYHLMPVNRKFLKIMKKGGTYRLDSFQKYADVGDFYIHRHDFQDWSKYCDQAALNSEADYLRLCRSQFTQLQQNFIDLVLVISDQTVSSTFEGGKDLFLQCVDFANKLIQNLEKIEEPWKVISSSAVGDFGSVERGTAVAAYAGLLSRKAKLGDPTEVMIATLFADVGYLSLSPSTTCKLRQNLLLELHAEERAEFFKHPIYSLNQCLSKRLPLSEEVKNMIMMSHERGDQKGFPNRPAAIKVTDICQLVRFAHELDSALSVKMGQERQDLSETFYQFVDQKLTENDGFSLTFLYKLKPYLSAGRRIASTKEHEV